MREEEKYTDPYTQTERIYSVSFGRLEGLDSCIHCETGMRKGRRLIARTLVESRSNRVVGDEEIEAQEN